MRPRPVTIKRGLARCCNELPHARAVPVAIEYPFWNERLPECLLRFGAPVSAGTRSVAELHDALGAALESTLDELAAQAVARDAAPFDAVSRGGAAQGGLPTCRSACARGFREGASTPRTPPSCAARKAADMLEIAAWTAAALAALPAALLPPICRYCGA